MCAPVFGKESLRLLRRHLPLGKGGFPFGKLGYPSFVFFGKAEKSTFPSGKAFLFVGADIIRKVLMG